MRREQLAALRHRFSFACAYCGTTEITLGARLTVDHFRPTSRSGLDDESNWVYCCPECNHFKAAFWNAAPDKSLLNPLQDDVSQHLEERDGTLIGLTKRGERHIERLRLNREKLVAQRLNNAALARLSEHLQRAREQEEADRD